MALKLTKATSPSGPVFAHEVTGEDGPFECHSCRIPVVHVVDHIRNGDDQRLRRHVPAYFRRAKGVEHGSGCQYNVRGAVGLVLRKAMAADDQQPVFEQTDQAYRFRLNIPITVAAALPQETPTEAFGNRVARSWKTGRLDNYCRSALGLAHIWNSIESSEDRRELTTLVTLAQRDREIAWKNFCFPLTRYEQLLSHFQNNVAHYPVAVLVYIKNILRREGGRFMISCAAGTTCHPDRRVSPTIFATPSAVRGLEIEKQYIVFGNWKLGNEKSWSPSNSSRVITYHQVTLNMVRQAQWAAIDVATDGD